MSIRITYALFLALGIVIGVVLQYSNPSTIFALDTARNAYNRWSDRRVEQAYQLTHPIVTPTPDGT